MEILFYLTVVFREPMVLLMVALGVFAGIYVGVIPGLSGTMAVSLLVGFTFGWQVNNALGLMIGVFVGVVYGGSRTAIMLNMPATPPSVATALDGYPLAKRGLAGEAMGIATTQSVVGTLIGLFALIFFTPIMSRFAMNFHSVDYLILAIMGLMLAGGLGSKSVKRGIIAGAIGLFLGTVGVDPQTAVRRFTFDVPYLNAGVNFVVAMIGLFGASEAFMQLSDMTTRPMKQKVNRIIPSLKSTIKYFPLSLRSGLVGVLVGVLPGAGGDIAALLSYDQAKRTVRKPEVPFGEGAIEGLIAPETANSAAIGAAFIPMLTLGIPGDAITAVILSALFIHGMQPGPQLMALTPHLFYLIVACIFVACFFLMLFGLTGIKIFTRVVEIPKGILMPAILALSVIGAFAIRNNLYDIFWMFGFGILGYFLKRFNFPVAPIVLGVILCTLFENNYRRAVLLAGGSVPRMLGSIFQSGISVFLLCFIGLLLAMQSKAYRDWRQRRDDAKIAHRAASDK